MELAADATATATSALTTTPKGTPFDPDSSVFSVVSYNLLAPVYVRPVDTRTGEVQAFAAFK